ncbi:MAG: hypothetical protein M3198_18430 [Actinomycetota bacterium]|nr:hypothetical protein [Actinomycetota bacterium]
MDLEPRLVGLRSQDVYGGLQTVDQTSGLIAAELEATRLTGMAATIASNIKGIDVVEDYKALRLIAAHQWDIDALALPSVLEVLEDVGYITIHKGPHGKITKIDEHIHLLHDRMYEDLGAAWENRDPSELDEASVETMDLLAGAPTRLSGLTDFLNDPALVKSLLSVGEDAQLLKTFDLADGDRLVWSPYCGYENPQALLPLFEAYDDEAVRREFERVKAYQGLPLKDSAVILEHAVGHGILTANSIKGSGGEAAFAFLPYRAAPEYRHIKKTILDKALILLASVRYGQHYAKHSLRSAIWLLEALLEPNRILRATTEAKDQYFTAAQAQIIRLISTGGNWYRPQLIDTDDNKAAVRLALDLARYGEPVEARDDPSQRLLFTDGRYLTPLMTMKERKPQAALPGEVLLSMIDNIRGEGS